jgi:hypothetical protein
MTGLLVIAGSIAYIAVLIIIFRVIDRARGVDPDDRWSGWYRSRSTSPKPPFGPIVFSGQEYDSMDDHGNRDQDGGL